MEQAKKDARTALDDIYFNYCEAVAAGDKELTAVYENELNGAAEVYKAVFGETVYAGGKRLQYE